MTPGPARPGPAADPTRQPTLEPAPPGVPQADPDAVAVLRADLAGYTVDAVQALLGPVAHAALAREQLGPAVRICAGSATAVARLLEGFVLGRPVPRGALDAALPGIRTAGLLRLGLVRAEGPGPGDAVHGLVDLRPHAAAGGQDWWVVSDLGETSARAPLRTDHVLGIGGASVTLAQSTIRTPVGRVLDLGTGCGVQSLHAATHARHVIATDVSARALAFARLTLELNRPTLGAEVELREGDLLGPVAGERFDLIVSNPPFVITPRAGGVPAYEYRDAGGVGDEIVAELVRNLPALLAPGGVAQLLANWEHHRGEDWRERVGGWIDGARDADGSVPDLDAWVVQREVQDPAEYAELWIRDSGRPDSAGEQRLVEAWLDDFEARGVEAVGFGLVTLRRPLESRHGVRRLEECRGSRDERLGAHVADVLDALQWLACHDDEHLLAARLRVATDVTEERYHRPGEADPEVILLRQGGGFGRSVRATSELAAVVGACDGDLTVSQITAAVAHLTDIPVADVVASVVPSLRELVATAMLRVVG